MIIMIILNFTLIKKLGIYALKKLKNYKKNYIGIVGLGVGSFEKSLSYKIVKLNIFVI